MDTGKVVDITEENLPELVGKRVKILKSEPKSSEQKVNYEIRFWNLKS